jgi:uncharacterized protein YecT (DUF1311 family)/ABC-type cobalt transport system substrate-binding protein
MKHDEDDVADQAPKERKRTNRWLIVALVAAVLAGVLLASTVWDNRFKGEDNAAGDPAAESTPDLEKWCASQATYDAIRRELFRRAAQVRGSDTQAYARLSDFALLRVNGPVVRGIDDQLQSVSCSGTAVVNLPPGVAVAGGRRALSGEIDYIIQPAADGTGNVVRLGNVDSITVPLATLARTGAAQSAPLTPPETENTVVEEPPAGDEAPPVEEAPRASPSFDCGAARTGSEVAICSDPGLAALDRQMAAQFNDAMTQADRGQRRLLERTRDRFLGYRNRCATNQCIADTYRSRMREISDIMADRWRG